MTGSPWRSSDRATGNRRNRPASDLPTATGRQVRAGDRFGDGHGFGRGRATVRRVPFPASRFHHAADGHGFAVAIFRRSRRRVRAFRSSDSQGNRATPTGSRQTRHNRPPLRSRRSDGFAPVPICRAVPVAFLWRSADGHAPTVTPTGSDGQGDGATADRFGQSPRPIFRRSRVRRGDLPTVTGAPADGHAVKTKCAYNRYTFPRRMFQPWRGSTFKKSNTGFAGVVCVFIFPVEIVRPCTRL